MTPVEVQLGEKPKRFWEKWIIPLERSEKTRGTKIIIVAKRMKSKGEKRATRANEGKKVQDWR